MESRARAKDHGDRTRTVTGEEQRRNDSVVTEGKKEMKTKKRRGGGRAWLTPLSDEQQHGHAHVINKRQVTPPGEYGVPEHDTVLNMELAGEHQPHPPAETANNRCHETQEGSKPVLLQSSETYAHAI